MVTDSKALTENDFITYEDLYKFDFDKSSSNVTASGYITFPETLVYSLGVQSYGWTTTPVTGTDRTSPTDLLRDFCWGWNNIESLKITVDSDNSTLYKLTFTCGDNNYRQAIFDIYIEGIMELENVDTISPGNFIEETAYIECEDDIIDISFDCTDDASYTMACNALEIEIGVFDIESWQQYQIEENQGLIVVFFLIALVLAVSGLGLAVSKRR